MKTSTEMQLKIIDKMRENVERGVGIFEGIQYLDICGDWEEFSGLAVNDLRNYAHRIKPETITINGVEIPKPLGREEIEEICIERKRCVYSVSHKDDLCEVLITDVALTYGYSFVYRTKEEAIEASKLLFGIEE